MNLDNIKKVAYLNIYDNYKLVLLKQGIIEHNATDASKLSKSRFTEHVSLPSKAIFSNEIFLQLKKF